MGPSIRLPQTAAILGIDEGDHRMDTPRIISVDDHVVEPPTLWTNRIPAKFRDRAPRVERDSAVFQFEGGVFSFEKGVEGGEPCDWWLYDDLVYPFPKLSAAVGFDELDVTPTTFESSLLPLKEKT